MSVIWHMTTSLDGFIAGNGHDMSFAFGHSSDEPSLAARVRTATGAVLGGHGWHRVARRDGGANRSIYGGNWSGPVFVLSHHPQDDDVDPGVTYVDEPIDQAVARARDAAGDKDVLLLGANVANQAILARLVDEVVVHITPMLLGTGTPLNTLACTARLELIDTHRSDQLVDIRYRVTAG